MLRLLQALIALLGLVLLATNAASAFAAVSAPNPIEGTLTDTTGVTLRSALPGPGGLGGGLPEVLVPNAGSQICIMCVSGVNPAF